MGAVVIYHLGRQKELTTLLGSNTSDKQTASIFMVESLYLEYEDCRNLCSSVSDYTVQATLFATVTIHYNTLTIQR